MLKHLYLTLEQKLLAVTDEQPNPQPLFKHCQTPAVFVEFEPLQWRTDGQHIQDADLTVRLHIVTPWYANTASNVQDAGVRATALAYLDIPTVLFRKLHGQHGTVWDNSDPQNPKTLGHFNALTRTASAVNHDHERFVDSVETYQCHLKDLSFTVPTVRVDTVGLALRPDSVAPSVP